MTNKEKTSKAEKACQRITITVRKAYKDQNGQWQEVTSTMPVEVIYITQPETQQPKQKPKRKKTANAKEIDREN